MQPTKADNWIGEEHLLNFVVNSLNEEFLIDLGEDVEVSTEDLGQSHLRNDRRLSTRQYCPWIPYRSVRPRYRRTGWRHAAPTGYRRDAP